MFHRLKNRMRRTGSSDPDYHSYNTTSSSSQTQRLRVVSPSPNEAQEGYNAKLSDLASFGACVEACDALAASSSMAQSTATLDPTTGLTDCSVVVSANGDLLLLPQTPAMAAVGMEAEAKATRNDKEERKGDAQQPSIQEGEEQPQPMPSDSDTTTPTTTTTTRREMPQTSLADSLESPNELDEPILDQTHKQQQHQTNNTANPTTPSKSNPLQFPSASEDYTSAVIMGNDLKPGGDHAINGFSAMGWSAAATSLAVRQTELTLRHMSAFVSNIVQSGRDHSLHSTQACDTLRAQTGIGNLERHMAFPPTPLPAAMRERWRQNSQTVDLNSLSDLEPIGSSWKSNFGNGDQPHQFTDLANHRVGPLLYSGSSLYSAMIALEQYHELMAENDSHRYRRATLLGGVLPQLHKTAEETAERAYHREKALKDMQKRANEMEQRLQSLKATALQRWDAVYQAEDSVTQILEERLLERSRIRERQRLEQLRREAEENELQQVQLGATSSEIWDIVNSVTESMEDGDFTPIGFPVAPVSGPIDQSSTNNGTNNNNNNNNDYIPNGGNQTNNTTTTLPPNSPVPGTPDPTPMISRVDVEREVDLPGLRNAALAAEEAVEDAAQTLLNVLSTLDTTRRSARVAAETCLLAACNAQADTIQAMVQLERQEIEDRLESLRELEQVVAGIDVRQDLDTYIRADKKERGGSTWMGDYDDGGIASALAILSSHIDGSMGQGPGSPAMRRLEWGVGENDEDDKDIPHEALEDAVDELFFRNELLFSENKDKEGSAQAREEYQAIVDKLCRVASDTSASPAVKSKRSTICYALNSKRSEAELPSRVQLDGLSRVFQAILSGCDSEIGGIANAKMCMMLSQTFYIVEESQNTAAAEQGTPTKEARTNRVYVKSQLIGHPLWEEDEFWDQTLNQCVAESLTNSGVMQSFERSNDRRNSSHHTRRNKKSEWGPTSFKLKWHDLSHSERSEAATQVHAVVFAQLGALAHSMMEFGCGIERSCNFVRRMSIRNQLPISQRTMLLQHLFGRENKQL